MFLLRDVHVCLWPKYFVLIHASPLCTTVILVVFVSQLCNTAVGLIIWRVGELLMSLSVTVVISRAYTLIHAFSR